MVHWPAPGRAGWMASGCGSDDCAETETSGTTGWLNCTTMRALSFVVAASAVLSAGEVLTTANGSFVKPAGNRLPGLNVDAGGAPGTVAFGAAVGVPP